MQEDNPHRNWLAKEYRQIGAHKQHRERLCHCPCSWCCLSEKSSKGGKRNLIVESEDEEKSCLNESVSKWKNSNTMIGNQTELLQQENTDTLTRDMDSTDTSRRKEHWLPWLSPRQTTERKARGKTTNSKSTATNTTNQKKKNPKRKTNSKDNSQVSSVCHRNWKQREQGTLDCPLLVIPQSHLAGSDIEQRGHLCNETS